MAGSSVADLAGRVLADRYRLLAPVGTGASGRVYVADDTRLRRRVALKVLHAALADDAAFLRRFRAEAQVAASLNHRHIVTVYDWGEDDVPFLVLELLEGGSLRAMLDEGHRLSPAQAARLGRDVASALEYAHARGIVHRDVKPANLLFDEHGIVRVADFGLARALAEASWTEPAGAMFGTARYASPEQAIGAQLDARSDLYSLALVLVESVTGRLPFASDTPIGTLAARTQRPLPAPPELGPLAAVVERAGQIEPEDRYPDAATMGAALADAADALPRPAPLALVGMHDHPDPHPTTAQVRSAYLYDQDASDDASIAIVTDTAPRVRVRVRSSAQPRRIVPFVVAFALVLVLALVAFGLARSGASPVEVPGLVGRSRDAAALLGRQSGVAVKVVAQQASSDPAGTVVKQDPAAGSWLHGGGTVDLTVSSGPAPLVVPNIAHANALLAVQRLSQAGFVVAAPSHKYSATVPRGDVISISPAAGALVPPESKVSVVVSDGPPPIKVADVHGESTTQATQQLTAQHFKVQQQSEFNDTVPAGQVTRTSPPANQLAPYGSTITIYVSKGPQMIPVPDLRGDTVEAATTQLNNLGFQVNINGNYKPGKTVKKQDPHSGKALAGSTITLGL
jgi:eukaryotic-like serine/threonine-protein kinase